MPEFFSELSLRHKYELGSARLTWVGFKLAGLGCSGPGFALIAGLFCAGLGSARTELAEADSVGLFPANFGTA